MRLRTWNPDGTYGWSPNEPSENVGWRGHIGGSAIVPQRPVRGEPATIKHLRQKLRRLEAKK
jgi:hypothetical protein